VQRLGVRFDRAGLKTLFTDVASLKPAEGGSGSSAGTADASPRRGGGHAWVHELEGAALSERMGSLPEEATDPFRPLSAQLRASLELCRFTPQASSVLDWASTQTGLSDPLSRFSRHELEEHFARFQRALERHLGALVEKARRSEPETLRAALSAAPSQARDVVKRLDARR
jgi:hypothetical protein